MGDRQKIDAIRSVGATAEGSYTQVNLAPENTMQAKAELGEAIRATYSALKGQIEAFFYGEGLSQNVTNANLNIMNDPNQYIEVQGKRFYPHSGVGRLQAYNELGNPSGGCFTLHTMG